MLTLVLLLACAPRRPGRGGRRPAQARAQLVGHDLDHRPGSSVQPSMSAVSGQTHPVSTVDTAPSRTVRSWTPARSQRRGLAPTRACADGALHCSDSHQPPALSAVRQAAQQRAARGARPTGCPHRARGVHSDRCPVSIRSGVRGLLLAVLSAVCRRSDGLPCGQRTARTPQGTAVCGAAPWPRATGRARRRAGRCLGAASGAGRRRPDRRAGPAPRRGPGSSRGG